MKYVAVVFKARCAPGAASRTRWSKPRSGSDCFPDRGWACRAGEIGDTERRKSIKDRVGDGREGGDRAGLATAFDAERVGGAAGAVEPKIVWREIVGARHCPV